MKNIKIQIIGLFFYLCLFLNGPIFSQNSPQDINFKINIGTQHFDPQNDTIVSKLNQQAQVSPNQEYNPNQILQFNTKLNIKQMAYLKKTFKLSLNQYIQGNAYLERVTSNQLDSLKTSGFLRWHGNYPEQLKIEQHLISIPFDSLTVGNGTKLKLMVNSFPGAQIESILNAIKKKGIKVEKTINAGEATRFLVTVDNLEEIYELAKINDIMSISRLGKITLNNGTRTGIIQSGSASSKSIWEKGLFGQGQIISVIDEIIDMNHCFFRSADGIDNTPSPDHRKVLKIRDRTGRADSEPFHGTLVSATAAGEDINNTSLSTTPNPNNGHAPKARLVNSNIEDIIDEEGGAVTFYQALVDAANDGAFIHNNSWVNVDVSGYTNFSVDADRFIWENENHVVLVAPLNAGFDDFTGDRQPVWAPSNAKNALVVNNSEFRDFLDRFTYDSGIVRFTEDGRIKPDVIAPGADIVTAIPNTECDTGSEFVFGSTRVTNTGTSLSTPAIAGAVALTRQYFQEGWYPNGVHRAEHGFTPSGALLKAMIINASRGFGSTTTVAPALRSGWGQPILDNSLYFEGDSRNLTLWEKRHRNGITTGNVDNYSFKVVSNSEPLRITLVWNDPPGTNLATDPVINDLDLEVITTDFSGREVRYFGNQMNPFGSVTGGAFDDRNNVENVILSNPAPGNYTILIHGRAVNVGQPGQGYALVTSGDLEDPPRTTGTQNTLVVRAGISDINSGNPAEITEITNKMTAVQGYMEESSYRTATINYEIFDDESTTTEFDPVVLDNNKAFYYSESNSPLIELADEIISKMLLVNENVFDKGTDEDTDDIDRLVIITNDEEGVDPWSTTGPWTYNLPDGLTRRISVSVLPASSADGNFSHAISQQLGLIDLHSYEQAVVNRRLVDKWDNMSTPYTNNGNTAWSKTLASWISAHGSEIQFVPRPDEGDSFSDPAIGINYVTSQDINRKAIAIGLTPGITNIENERVFYFIEAREQNDTTLDGAPEEGTIIYYVNDNIPQGFGPVKIIDTNLSTPDDALANIDALDDAALTLTDNTYTNLDLGLTIVVQSGTGGSDFNINLIYAPPSDQNDVNIRTGDPFWTSPDIWVDAPPFTDDPESISEDSEEPIPDVVNRIYFRIHNRGAIAGGFNVLVRVSEPYHTVNGQPGGTPDFNVVAGNLFVPQIDDEFIDFVEWTPEDDGDTHSCIEVNIPNVFNDINAHNNRAQQNVKESETTRGSPYKVTTYNFGFTNSESTPELFYFRTVGIPDNWTYSFSPKKAFLAPGERLEGTLTVQPPENTPVCTEYPIQITSWLSEGETLLLYGGSTLQVNLRNKTKILIEASNVNCSQNNQVLFKASGSEGLSQLSSKKDTCNIIVEGCTIPSRPFEVVVIEYIHPSGYPLFKEVLTDERGCFSDFMVTAEGGTWNVTGRYSGDDCSSNAIAPWMSIAIPLPSSNDQDNDGLPDAKEPQGDHDGDGIVGIFDTDSDNDGIQDGEERENCITNPDCNNNGIIDGKEGDVSIFIKERDLRFSFHVGSTHPFGDLNEIADANIYARADISTPITDRIRLMLMGGVAQFTADNSVSFPNPRFWHGSLNAQYNLFTSTAGTNFFLQGGGGIYGSKSKVNDVGFNIGLGGRIPIKKPLELEFGLDYHHINNGLNTRFITLQLGVLFK